MTAAAGGGRRIVIGVGNRERGDDAIGPAVCDRVRMLDDTVDVWVVESDVSSLAVRWRPDDTVVVVDAVVTGSAAGTLHELDPDRLPAVRPMSSHALGAGEAIALATALGTRPRDLSVIGVEATSFEHGAPMTPAVAGAADRVARFVLGRPDGGAAAPAIACARRED